MINSLIMLGVFAAGVLATYNGILPHGVKTLIQGHGHDLVIYALYPLVVLVGITTGADEKSFAALRQAGPKILLVPLSVIVGTLGGAAVVAMLLPMTVRDCLAAGAGFAYYTLSSIIIQKEAGDVLAVTALMANMIREISTLVLAPVMVRFFGPLSPIASAGAPSMDSALAVISRFSGSEYAVVSVFSGAVLTLLVPILVPFIFWIWR